MTLKDKQQKTPALFLVLRYLESSMNLQQQLSPTDSIKSKVKRTSSFSILVAASLMSPFLLSTMEFLRSLQPRVTLILVVKTSIKDLLNISAKFSKRSTMLILRLMFVHFKSSSPKLKRQREICPQSCRLR